MMHTGDCITSRVARPPTFRSTERAGNRRGKSEASGENEKRLSSTWIGSGAEKELPARRRSARTTSLSPPLPLLSHCLLMVITKSTLVHFRPFIPPGNARLVSEIARTRCFFFFRDSRTKKIYFIYARIIYKKKLFATKLECFYYYKNRKCTCLLAIMRAFVHHNI